MGSNKPDMLGKFGRFEKSHVECHVLVYPCVFINWTHIGLVYTHEKSGTGMLI